MNKIGLTALGILLSITCCCTTFCSGILVMFAPDAPVREFTPEDLLIDESSFPDGWGNTVVTHDTRCYGGIPGREVLSRFAMSKDDEKVAAIAVEQICKVDKTWRASLLYEDLFGLYVFTFLDMNPLPSGIIGWENPPAELSFASEIAEEWAIKCKRNTEINAWQECTYFSRYKEFLVQFDIITNINDNTESINFEELEKILFDIDIKMKAFLCPEDQNKAGSRDC